jgi:hypothetical protein
MKFKSAPLENFLSPKVLLSMLICTGALLVSCGNSSDLKESVAQLLPDPSLAVVNKQLIVATSPVKLQAAGAGDGTNALNATNLFDWAETAYPSLFPGHQLNQSYQSYTYRYYPTTQNYLGLSNDTVYILGPVSSGTLTSVGVLSDFNCNLNPASCGSKNSSTAASVSTSGASALYNGFNGNVVLGNPTKNSISANIFTPDQSGTVYIGYGLNSQQPNLLTSTFDLQASKPTVIDLTNLLPDTLYYYQLFVQLKNTKGYLSMGERSFHTARAPGSGFVFTIQGDSHPERFKTQFDPGLYTRTLTTALSDQPDFHITLGDDFSVDTLDPTTITQAQVAARYTLQRPFLGIIGASAPVFLTNGNHEQAARYLLDGTENNVAVWAQNARNLYFTQPAPSDFYAGNAEQVPFVGLLKNYFSWTWGDALFCVIDPYWSSPVPVDNVFGGSSKRSNLWDVTHGDAQYQWLKKTLESSTAKYKFVFAHHVLGTGRGGVELASLWEWGGKDQSGAYLFTQQRPSWPDPIHQLFVKNKVSIFFQGHDHIWVHQNLDGVTYQTISEPADPFYALYNSEAYIAGERFPNSGYTRVSVNPSQVKVEYVRTYLQGDETSSKISGKPVFSYTLK